MIVWLTEIQMEQQLNDSLSMQYFVINIFQKKSMISMWVHY